jgi:conjugal transfer pilus assembly protein TraK
MALVSGLSLPALALQVLDARDGVAIEAILSIKEPTRIRIEGAPITDVFGNIHSSSCGAGNAAGTTAGIVAPATNPGGEVVLECDRDKGEIYIRPVGDSPKPVNLFVSSAHATYTLVLRRADTPADTIVIRDRSQRTAPASLATGPQVAFGPSSPSAHHIRTMKALLVAMASDRVPPDIRVDELHQPMQLWAETRFALMSRYEGRGLVGEKYLLKNIGQAAMVLSEQEFDRPDSKEGGQVLGVSVENHNLRPGETTQVFVIRRGGQP